MQKLVVCLAFAAACVANPLYRAADGGGDGPAAPDGSDQDRCAAIGGTCNGCFSSPCPAGSHAARDFVCPAIGSGCALNCCIPDRVDPCAGKSESACRHSQACVADYCYECSCTPTYVGCRLAGGPPISCPALGCALPECCRVQSDCRNLQRCFAPGESLGCGICMVPPVTCSSDVECRSGEICAVAPCTCGGQQSCTPGCTTTGCPDGQVCGSSNHCVPLACGSCPREFTCASGGSCARRTCTQDSDCPQLGFCVNGQCYIGQGSCQSPAA